MADTTFQLQYNPSQQRLGASGQGPALGVSGGGNSQFGVVAPSDWGAQDFNTGVQIPAFIAALVEPKLAAQKQQKFYEGFARARAGATQAEIQDESPWFKHIFGMTPYEEGSAVFHTQKAANDMQSEFMRRLPELRKMRPEEIGDQLNQITQAGLTGDLFSDSLIRKSIMDASGPMLEAHTKARYAWQQDELVKGQNQAILSAGEAYQEYMVATARMGKENPGQVPDPESVKESTRMFLQSWQSPEGQDEASYKRNVMTTLDQLADKGQWYAVNALRDSGALGMLDPEDADKLDGRLETARLRGQRRIGNGPMMQPIAQAIAAARAGATSAAESVAALQDIDHTYESLTGDRDGFFTQKDYTSIAESSAGAMYNAWERLMNKQDAISLKLSDASAKQLAEDRNSAVLATAVGAGEIGAVADLQNVSKEDAERAFVSGVMADPADAPRKIVSNYASQRTFVSQRLKDQLQTNATRAAGEEWSQSFDSAYQTWKGIRYHELQTNHGPDKLSGAGAALSYYGPEINRRMQQYDDSLRAGDAAEIAYRRSFGNEASFGGGDIRGADAAASKEARASVLAVVKNTNPSWYQIGSNALGSSGSNVVLNAVSRNFALLKQNSPEYSDKDLADQALQMAKANGLEIAGAFAWQNTRDQAPVSKFVGMAPDVFEKTFERAILNKYRTSGISVGSDTSIMFLRLADDADGPRMVSEAMVDGKRMMITITGKDLKKLRNKEAATEIDARKPEKVSNALNQIGRSSGRNY